MTRQQGIEMAKKYDYSVSDDMEFWSKYVDMPLFDFWNPADTLRDHHVWWADGN